MHVYLIRHAQSQNNVLTAESMSQRYVDPALTELGFRQRDKLADFLATQPDIGGGFAIDRLYTSAMYRSLLTAQPVSQALNRRPIVWPDLHEKGGMYKRENGAVQGHGGMTRQDIEREFPAYRLPEAVTDSGWYDRALGYEPETRSFYRAIKVAQDLSEWRKQDAVIALISHAGFLDVLLKAIFGQLPSRPHTMRYYHDNTAITRVNYEGSRPILHYMNRVDHLPAAMRTF